jgi:hypothetical protein
MSGLLKKLFEKTFRNEVRDANLIEKEDLSPLPVELGDLVVDIVTSFRGVVVMWESHLHGCDRLSVEPDTLKPDGETNEINNFDLMRLVVVKKAVIVPIPPKEAFGRHLPGAKVKDDINGLEGIIAVRVTSYTGDVSVLIDPAKMKDDGSGPAKGIFVHADRVTVKEVVPPPVSPATPPGYTPGGPVETRARNKPVRG